MSVLHLTLKKKWFDMIASGEKKEEYREIKRTWLHKLCFNKPEVAHDMLDFNTDIKEIHAFNGWAFSEKYPNIKWKHEGIRIGKPNPEWCEQEDVGKDVFILSIGEIIQTNL